MVQEKKVMKHITWENKRNQPFPIFWILWIFKNIFLVLKIINNKKLMPVWLMTRASLTCISHSSNHYGLWPLIPIF